MRSLTSCAAALLLAAAAPAGADPDLRGAALTALAEGLARPGTTFSRPFLSRVARDAGVDSAAAATGLRALLDTLDAARQAESPAWLALTALGGDEVGPEQVDRLLREAIDWGRRACAGEGDYALERIVERAAAKARVPPARARRILVGAVAAGGGAPTVAPSGWPERVGLLVVGTSAYRVDASRFPGLFVTADDPSSLDRFRQFHVSVARALVEVLPGAEGVRWAIGQPHPPLQPDGVVRFEIAELRSTWTRRGTGGTGPIVTLVVRYTLEPTHGGAPSFADELTLTYDFRSEEDERIRNQRRLDGLAARAAVQLRDAVARGLAARRRE